MIRETLKNGKAIGIRHVGAGGNITAQALKEMIPKIKEMGIEFVYLSEIAYKKSRSPAFYLMVKTYFSGNNQCNYHTIKKVAEQVSEFIKGYNIHFIEQDLNTYRETERIMVSDLLSPNDANHYACYMLGPLDEKRNRTGPLDFLVTLDGDFERVAGNGQIIKIAS